ncbi:MAG TPA: MFS transporter [Microbacteriaceae bacterium]|nr:MFS transporter [Microbacteriaceae bacterium]
MPDPDSTPPSTGPHRTFVDLSPLKASPAFARLWIGQAISGIGAWMTITAVGLIVFDIAVTTMDEHTATFMVSLVGGIALLPMIVAGLWGGMIADAFDRRTVAIWTAIVSWLSTAALCGLAFWDAALLAEGQRAVLWPFYLVTTINAVATTISASARSAAIPRLLPTHLVSRAAALNGLTFGLQIAAGPLIAGVLIAAVGFPATFAVDAVLFTAGFIGVVGLPRLPPLGAVTRPGLRSLVEGLRFLRQAPNIRLSFVADIIAMSLGRPHVLFPALGASVLGGGAVTVGILTAAVAVGTFLTGAFSGPVARVHRHGLAIGRAIIVFGAFTVLFGLVIVAGLLGWWGEVGPDFSQVSWLGLLLAAIALAGTGASDEVSAIFRSTMLLIAAPDEMRGRMQGIFMVVVAGGPRLGEMVTGLLAVLLGLWAGPILGGTAIMLLLWVLLRTNPRFRAYDARNPTP